MYWKRAGLNGSPDDSASADDAGYLIAAAAMDPVGLFGASVGIAAAAAPTVVLADDAAVKPFGWKGGYACVAPAVRRRDDGRSLVCLTG